VKENSTQLNYAQITVWIRMGGPKPYLGGEEIEKITSGTNYRLYTIFFLMNARLHKYAMVRLDNYFFLIRSNRSIAFFWITILIIKSIIAKT
jgi:hypothetical protein